MTKKATLGPCGRPLEEIVDMADRVDRMLAGFGLTDPEDRLAFFSLAGQKLTAEFLRLESVTHLTPYQQRQKQVGATAAESLIKAGCLHAGADLGAFAAPIFEESRLGLGLEAVLSSFRLLRTAVGASPSDFLDLLVWVQTALMVRKALGTMAGAPSRPAGEPARQLRARWRGRR